jgi:hypothetical protein
MFKDVTLLDFSTDFPPLRTSFTTFARGPFPLNAHLDALCGKSLDVGQSHLASPMISNEDQ